MGVVQNRAAARRRTMIIGIDGATFDLIRPWAEAGLLPTFQRLMEQGAWGSLESTMPPVTPAAWSSLATGTKPGKHGLFDFFARSNGRYERTMVNATHRHGASLWRLLSEAGVRTTVFNVPATYPPEQVNGLMVSGLLTPNNADDASWPPELLRELKQAVPDFSFYPPGIFSAGEEVKFVNDVLAWDQMTLRATEFLLEQQPWDFFFTVFIGVDVVSHFMWREMATNGASVRTNDQTVRETLAGAIQSVYRQADTILGRLLEAVGDDTYVMVVSDHGFGPLDYYMHLNAWLVDRGYMRFKRRPAVFLRYLAYRLGITPLTVLGLLRALRLGGRVQQSASKHNAWLKALVKGAFLSLADVDWSRTTVYSSGYAGPLFVNLKGREAEGIVEPGDQFEAVLRQLAADLQTLRHPVTGEPYVSEIYRADDLFSGPYTHLAPDLIFEPRDWRNQVYGVLDFALNRWLQPTPDRTGTHRMNGILLMHGPGIRPGALVEGAALWDVAPTILGLMGVPIPKQMDGRVLSEALSDELLSQLHVTYREADEEVDRPATARVMSEEEERIIRERLEALGYGGG